MKTILNRATPILAALYLTVATAAAEVVVEAPGAIIAGKTISEWTAAWWQWAVTLAPPGDPFTDTTGEFANVKQSGPVFFLAGSPNGSRSRQIYVPTNAYVLVPLLAGEWSQLELGFNQTAAQIRLAAQQQADQFDSLHATLDGAIIEQATLFTHRQASPNFSFVSVSGNLVNVPSGASGIAVADGYFLMIAPLSLGTHVLNYGGGSSAFGINLNETDTITALGPPPTITLQPTNQTTVRGSNATFNVSATTSNPPIHYQWKRTGINLPGATNESLTIFNAQSTNAGQYLVVVSDALGLTNSTLAQLRLIEPVPVITVQPTNSVGRPSSNITFTVVAEGAAPLRYQWRFNQADITGATNSTLVVTNAQPGQIGNYVAVITNGYGASTSSVATLRLLGWTRKYGGQVNSSTAARAVAVDGSDNVVVTGYSSNNANYDYYTAKYGAANGALVWEKRYNGNADDFPNALAVDGSGNVAVTGYSMKSNGTSDYYTAKYAVTNGALLWQRPYNGLALGDDSAWALAVDGSGNVVVTGNSIGLEGNYDYFTIKYAAANGAILWEKRYNGSGNGGDYIYAMALDGAGNVVVTGTSTGLEGNNDLFTIKYAAVDGAVLWEKRYDGPGRGADSAVALAIDGVGSVVVTGSSIGLEGNDDYYTTKYAAADGAVLWEQRYNGSGNQMDHPSAVALDGAGNVVLTGGATGLEGNLDYYTIKYAAADGAVLWEQSYKGPGVGTWGIDFPSALAVDGSGNVVVAGQSGDDAYTVAYAGGDGAVIWDYLLVGGGPPKLALDLQGNAIVAASPYDPNISGYAILTLKILTPNPIYRFTSIAFTNGSLQLSWTPAPGLVLQRTTNLNPPDWQTVGGSANTNRVEVPVTGASGFFRLLKP